MIEADDKNIKVQLSNIKSSFAKTATDIQSRATTMKNFVTSAFVKIRAAADRAFSSIYRYSRYAVLAFVALGTAAIKMAMSAQESESLFEVSMGNMADATRKWSNEISKALYLNAYDVRKYVGTFNVMLKSMGQTPEVAAEMSKTLTELTYDMSSFHDLKPDEIFTKLQGAITGESESLKKLGYVVNETAVRHKALEMGLISGKEQLTESQKITARFATILDVTKDAQGDLARTCNNATNVFRGWWAVIKMIAVDLGNLLLPRVTKVGLQMRDWLVNNKDQIIAWGDTVATYIKKAIDWIEKLTKILWKNRKAALALTAAFVGFSIINPIIIGVGLFISVIKGLTAAYYACSAAMGIWAATATATAKLAAGLTATTASLTASQLGAAAALRASGVAVSNFVGVATGATVATLTWKAALVGVTGVFLKLGAAFAAGYGIGILLRQIEYVRKAGWGLAYTLEVVVENARFVFKQLGETIKWVASKAIGFFISKLSDLMFKFAEFVGAIEYATGKDLGFKSLLEQATAFGIASNKMLAGGEFKKNVEEHKRKIGEIAKAYEDSYQKQFLKVPTISTPEAAKLEVAKPDLMEAVWKSTISMYENTMAANKKLKETTAEDAAAQASAIRDMYSDMGNNAKGYFEFAKQAIVDQAAAYKKLGIDEVFIKTWSDAQMRKLDIERLESSGKIFDALKAKYMRTVDDLKNIWKSFGDSVTSSFESAIETLIFEGGRFRDFFTSVVREISMEFIRMQFIRPMAGWLSAGVTSMLGGIPKLPVPVTAPATPVATPTTSALMAHSGITVGEYTSSKRVVPTSIFAGAKKYHGLREGEQAIIAEKGEVISRGERPVNVNFNIQAIDTQTGVDFLMKNAGTIASATRKAVRNNHPSGRS